MSKKLGNEFGKVYRDKMVSGYKDVIALLEKAISEFNYPEIKAGASATIPVLRKHLDHYLIC